jgi:hypothetical protein
MLFRGLGCPIKKQHVTAKQRNAPQHRISNQEERQSCREPKVAHIPAWITARLRAISNVPDRIAPESRQM